MYCQRRAMAIARTKAAAASVSQSYMYGLKGICLNVLAHDIKGVVLSSGLTTGPSRHQAGLLVP